MEEEADDPIERLTEMSFVSETSHEDGFSQSPVLLSCLPLITRSPNKDHATSTEASEKSSPIIPLQFGISGLSQPTGDLNFTPHELPDGCSQERHSDYNPEASQSLFTSVGTTVAEENTSGRYLNLCDGDGTTQPLEDSTFSQTMFGFSQESLLEEPEKENTEVEEALHHTINTLCERLSATTDDNCHPSTPTLTVNPDNTDSTETVQATLTDILQQTIPTTSSYNDVLEEDDIVRSLVKPLSDENGTRLEENKNNFSVEELTFDREKNASITADFTLPLQSRQTDLNQCEENYLLRDDCMHYPSQNLFSKTTERPKLNCNEVEEKCDLAYENCPRKDSGKELTVSNDRPPDSRHNLQTKPMAVSGTDTGQIVVNGELTSCKANEEVIKKNATENCTYSTSSESSKQVGRYPHAKKTTHKFKVPYNTQNDVNMNASSTTEQADHNKLGYEGQTVAIATAVPTDRTAHKNSDAHTQNDYLGINNGESKKCSNKSKIHPLQRGYRTSFLAEKGDIDTCAVPKEIKQKNVLIKDRPSERNENTSTEQAENVRQKKYKDCDMNRDERDNTQNERESEKAGEFTRKGDNLTVHSNASDGKYPQKSENNPKICEYGPSRQSGNSQDVNGDSATEMEVDKQSDNGKIITTGQQNDVQLIPQTEFQESDRESASAPDSICQQGQPDFTSSQRLPPNDGTTARSEERTGQTFQIILSRARDISSAVMKQQNMDHGRELALLKRFRQLYDAVSDLSSSLSAEQISDLSDTAEIFIRDINKRQGEEKATLADRIKRGKMKSSEKMATKQELQQLTERCTALQAVFKIHRELKRRTIGDKADCDQQTQLPKTRNSSKATETCGSPCRRQSRKQETQTSSSVQHATSLQSANTKSKTDQNLKNNIPRNEITASIMPETNGGKKEPCKTIPNKSTGAQSTQILTNNTCKASTIKHQEKNKVVKRDRDPDENSSQMSQSILQPIPKTNPMSTSSTSKPYIARCSPQICQNESSGLNIKPLLESELETPDSTSFDDLQKLRSPQELNSQEARGTKALSKSDSDENSKLHTDSLVKSPQTLSSEQCLQNFSQSSSQKRKELSPLVSSTAKNRCLPDILSSRAEDDKDKCDKDALPCFEDGRRQPYVDKKCRSLNKMVVETQEVDMDVDEHMLSPVHSGQVSTTVCDQEKENTPVLEIQECATTIVSPDNSQHTVDLVTMPSRSARPGAESDSTYSQPMSPDSTLPPECGSVSPVSSSKSLSVLQNSVHIKPSTLLYRSSPERESPKNTPDCSAVENSTERNDDQQHNASNTQKTENSIIMTRAQSNDCVENKTTSREPVSSCRKRSRNVSASEETASSDSVVIVHGSPKPKCRKTDQEIDANRQKSSFTSSSDVKGKMAVTGPVKSSGNAPEKNEIKSSSSSQNEQMNVVDTMSTQTNEEQYSDLFQKKIENNIPNVTFGTAAYHTQNKGLGARITEQQEQTVSKISSDASDGQVSQSIQIEVKQAQENQPVAHGNLKSLISHKTVPDLSKNPGPQPSQNATLKPPQTAVVITGRNPSAVQRDIRNFTARSVATPQRGSSPSSSMTSMTGIFPVSSQEILRKMAQEEAGLKPPSRNEPTTTPEASRSTNPSGDKGSAGVSAVQIYSEQNKVSKIRSGPGDKISLDTARKESTQTPAVWQNGPKQIQPGTQVIVMKKLPQGKAPLGSVPGSQRGPKPLFHHLLHAGVVHPGTLSLSFSFNGSEKKASILEDGRIQDATNLIFSSPLNWFRAVTGLTRAKRHAAYSQILYRGSTLEKISNQASLHHQATHPPPLSNSLTTTLPQPTVKAVLPGNTQPASNPHPVNRPAETTKLIHADTDKTLSGSSQPRQENSSNKPHSNPQSSSEHLSASRPMETKSLSAPAETRSASQSAPFLSSAGSRSNPEFVTCVSSSKLIASLRKVKLIEEQEVVPHASCVELVSFWSEDFAQVTMSPAFWATVDDWD